MKILSLSMTILGVLCMALILASPVLVQAADQPPKQAASLIPNGSFEKIAPNGAPAEGWWYYPANITEKIPAEVATLSVDAEEAYAGDKSLKFEFHSVVYPSAVSPQVPVNPGDTISYSVYYKSKVAAYEPTAEEKKKIAAREHIKQDTPRVISQVTYADIERKTLKAEKIEVKTTTDGWEQLEKTLIVPPRAGYVQVSFCVYDAIGVVRWDALEFKRLNSFSASPISYNEEQAIGNHTLEFLLENYTGAKDPLKLDVLVGDEVIATKTITPAGTAKENVVIDYELTKYGKQKLSYALTKLDDNEKIFSTERDLVVPEMLGTSLPYPTHVWSDENVTEIEEQISTNLSASQAETGAVLVDVIKQGVFIRSDRISPVGAQMKCTFPIDGLTAGDYQIMVRLMDKLGTEQARRLEKFHIMGVPRSKVEVKHGQLQIDGKSIFPIGMYAPRTDSKYLKEFADAGFTFFSSYSFEGNAKQSPRPIRGGYNELERAQKFGLYMLVSTASYEVYHGEWDKVRAKLRAVRAHPAVLGYMEEELLSIGYIGLQEFKKWSVLIREVDPDRPVTAYEHLRKTEAGAPVIMPWGLIDIGYLGWYPVPFKGDQTEFIVPQWLTDNVPLTNNPVWTCPQSMRLAANKLDKPRRYPTPEEYRAIAYLSIIHGAKGLFYFGGHVQDADFKSGEGDWPYLQKLVRDISDMSPVWLAPTSEKKITIAGGEKISMMLKELDGFYYLIAANRDRPKAEVTFTLPFEAARIIRKTPAGIGMDHPNVEIILNGDSFQDAFDRYAVHIYKIEK